MFASKSMMQTIMSRAMISRRTISVAKSIARSVQKAAIPSAAMLIRYASSINKVVANELKHEMAAIEGGAVNEELADVKAKILKSFKINEQPGFGVVKLEGKFKSEIIEVVFDCQDMVEVEPDAEEIEDGSELPEDADLESSAGIRFQVIITKGGSKILFQCVAGERFDIDNVQHVPAGKDMLDQKLYGGPDFAILNEDMQTSFYEYLQERGIDEDFSFFVLSYANDKEAREYTTWLKKIKDFTA